MAGFFFGLIVLIFLFWLGFKLTGALVLACIWLFIKLPIGLMLLFLGLVCCCTILLIPVGIPLCKGGVSLLVPGL